MYVHIILWWILRTHLLPQSRNRHYNTIKGRRIEYSHMYEHMYEAMQAACGSNVYTLHLRRQCTTITMWKGDRIVTCMYSFAPLSSSDGGAYTCRAAVNVPELSTYGATQAACGM